MSKMIDIPSELIKYIVQDGRMSRIVDSAPHEIMKLAKETDDMYFKCHLSHVFSNFVDEVKK